MAARELEGVRAGRRRQRFRGAPARVTRGDRGVLSTRVLAAAFADEAVLGPTRSRAAACATISPSHSQGAARGMRRRELRRDYDPTVIACDRRAVAARTALRVPTAACRETLLANLVSFCARALLDPARAGIRKESR
jgi:hypothetical protein